MRATPRNAFRVFVVLLAMTALASRSRSDTLNITSSPTGATVEIDGIVRGTTPYCVSPLLNAHGEVIGINTLKALGTQGSEGGVSLQGIGFALSASDLIRLLRQFYPQSAASPVAAQPGAVGTLRITSDPTGAEIYIDGKFVGQTPSTIPTATGTHKIVLRSAGKKDRERELEVMKDSELTLNPVLEQLPAK